MFIVHCYIKLKIIKHYEKYDPNEVIQQTYEPHGRIYTRLIGYF